MMKVERRRMNERWEYWIERTLSGSSGSLDGRQEEES